MRRGFAIYLIATFVSMALVAYSQEVTRPLLAPSTTTVVESPDSKATLSSLRLKPNKVRAGENAKATVTLSAAAPEGGVLAKLSSSNPQVGDVDPSVTIDTGSRSATVIISTSPTSASSISVSPVSYRFSPAFVQPASSAQYDEETTPPGDDCADVNENGVCDVKEHTQRPEAKSVKQTVEVKITASLKGVTRSATLTVKGV